MKNEDLIGNVFGRLTVVSLYDNNISPLKEGMVDTRSARTKNAIKFNCKCECGNEAVVIKSYLTSRDTKSCGCLYKGVNKIHGMRYTSEYRSWNGIKSRCYNKNNLFYKDYVGRGITVCNRWKGSFENFFEDMGKKPTYLHSIDRIDNDKGYFPNNCKWATKKEQARNRRNSNSIIYKGKTKCLAEWCENLKLDYSLTYQRIYRYNYSVENAFNKDVKIMKNEDVKK